jgi:hypothetical protein
VKSLKLKQRPIDLVEHGELAKDPPFEHIYQDGEKEDAHKVNGGKGCDKQNNRRPKLSFEELLAKYKKQEQMSPISQTRSNHQDCLQSASHKSGIGKEIDLTQ